jgi:TPP-dependent pyruvate/acetoin dehydrogenase alpha subunit
MWAGGLRKKMPAPIQTAMNATSLLAFEEEIAQEFAAGNIRAPIHLGGGNEAQLIEIFKDIAPTDWVLSGWRSHHCLLKGVPRDKLKAAILAGRSVSLCFPEHKILCSGIVGGIAPIAVGLAWAIKRRGELIRVNCFLGDMTAKTGIVHEAMNYAAGHRIPVNWIVEDNGLSVCTDTKASWGLCSVGITVTRYNYNLSRPHAGIGRWVKF